MLKTKLGKWSVWLCAFFLVFLFFYRMIILLGESRGAFDLMPTIPPLPNYYIIFASVALFLGFLLAGLSFVTGLIGVLKFKERSWLLYTTLTISLIASFHFFLTLLF